MSSYNKVLANFEILKLDKMRNYFPNYLEKIKNQEIHITDILHELTEKEIEFRNERASNCYGTIDI